MNSKILLISLITASLGISCTPSVNKKRTSTQKNSVTDNPNTYVNKNNDNSNPSQVESTPTIPSTPANPSAPATPPVVTVTPPPAPTPAPTIPVVPVTPPAQEVVDTLPYYEAAKIIENYHATPSTITYSADEIKKAEVPLAFKYGDGKSTFDKSQFIGREKIYEMFFINYNSYAFNHSLNKNVVCRHSRTNETYENMYSNSPYRAATYLTVISIALKMAFSLDDLESAVTPYYIKCKNLETGKIEELRTEYRAAFLEYTDKANFNKPLDRQRTSPRITNFKNLRFDKNSPAYTIDAKYLKEGQKPIQFEIESLEPASCSYSDRPLNFSEKSPEYNKGIPMVTKSGDKKIHYFELANKLEKSSTLKKLNFEVFISCVREGEIARSFYSHHINLQLK